MGSNGKTQPCSSFCVLTSSSRLSYPQLAACSLETPLIGPLELVTFSSRTEPCVPLVSST
jgi:hypothetical protein